jgi:hypothetical protein
LLLGGSTFARNRVTFVLLIAALSLVPAIAWYVAAWLGWVPMPSGSGGVGFWFGVLGAAIIVFEMLLSLRKRVWRGRHQVLSIPLGKTQHWMKLHIWLGLIAIPLAIIHSGYKFAGFGSPSGWTMLTFLVVSASGIWGLALQQFLPRRIFEEVADETVAAEIEAVTERDIIAAEQMLRKLAEDTVLTGRAGSPAALAAPSATRLQELFEREIKPYLREGHLRRSPLRSVTGSGALFSQLHRELPEHAYESARRLARLCDIRRQRDRQRWLDGWLHAWLLVHIPLAVALVLLLTWHIVTALKLW